MFMHTQQCAVKAALTALPQIEARLCDRDKKSIQIAALFRRQSNQARTEAQGTAQRIRRQDAVKPSQELHKQTSKYSVRQHINILRINTSSYTQAPANEPL
jgi:hypothetical protein